jgi:hypothetical protein
MRPIRQPSDIPGQITADPAISVDRDTPTGAATSTTVAPAKTARTASKRFSATDNTTSANPGLPESRRLAGT